MSIHDAGEAASVLDNLVVQTHACSSSHTRHSEEHLESKSVEGGAENSIVHASTRSPVAPEASPASKHFSLSPCLPSRSKHKGKRFTNRQIAYEAALGTVLTWSDYGGLSSTRTNEDREEVEL